MSIRDGWMSLVVAAARTAGDVRELTLVVPDRTQLPSFTPGSHIIIDAGDRLNAYSLTGEFLFPDAYEVSVLKLGDGRGGSRWLHEQLEVGDRLAVSPPRSAFAPVTTARHHLLVAGGIGITPILSHIRAARLYGRSFEVIYACRQNRAAHVHELEALCSGRRQLRLATGRDELRTLLEQRLAEQPLGTVAYACGPPAMIEATRDVAAALGWPAERLLTERVHHRRARARRAVRRRAAAIGTPDLGGIRRLAAGGARGPRDRGAEHVPPGRLR